MVDRSTVEQLARLYDRRESLQKIRESAHKNFWMGVVDDGFSGTGSRSALRDALGGVGELAALLQHKVDERIETMMRDLDQQIAELGGEP